jgi:hypothetical protein
MFALRPTRFVAMLLTVCLLPAVAAAQDPPPFRAPVAPSAAITSPSGSPLRIATIAASAAAAADWASTYHALKNYHVHETNPLLRGLDDKPGRMVALGAAIDAGAVTAWNMTMGKKHPKLAVAGLWAMTAFRAYLTVHNIRNQQRAVPR